MLGGSGTAIVSYFTGKPNNFKEVSESGSEEATSPVGASDAVEGE
jgi:hypothetical protein